MQPRQWERYEEYVLRGITDLKHTQEEMWKEIGDIKSEDISEIRTEIAVLKLKCSIYGAIGAGIPCGVLAFLHYFSPG